VRTSSAIFISFQFLALCERKREKKEKKGESPCLAHNSLFPTPPVRTTEKSPACGGGGVRSISSTLSFQMKRKEKEKKKGGKGEGGLQPALVVC